MTHKNENTEPYVPTIDPNDLTLEELRRTLWRMAEQLSERVDATPAELIEEAYIQANNFGLSN